MAPSTSKSASSDDGKEYVVVKTGSEVIPTPVSSESEKEEEPTKAPEILYKVQYKDYDGLPPSNIFYIQPG